MPDISHITKVICILHLAFSAVYTKASPEKPATQGFEDPMDYGNKVLMFPALDPDSPDPGGSNPASSLSLDGRISDDKTSYIHQLTWSSEWFENFHHVDLATRTSDGTWTTVSLTHDEGISGETEITVPADQSIRYHYRLIPYVEEGQAVIPLRGTHIVRNTVIPDKNCVIEGITDKRSINVRVNGYSPFSLVDSDGEPIEINPTFPYKIYSGFLSNFNENRTHSGESTQISDKDKIYDSSSWHGVIQHYGSPENFEWEWLDYGYFESTYPDGIPSGVPLYINKRSNKGAETGYSFNEYWNRTIKSQYGLELDDTVIQNGTWNEQTDA